MNNLFICHRPYQVIFSYLYSKMLKDSQNDCMVFNVYNILNDKYEDCVEGVFKYESMFRNVFKYDRSGDKRFYNIPEFRRYYKTAVKNMNKKIDELDNYDNIYFFSDKEFIVEILLRLLNEKNKQAKYYLIDEGIASKVNNNNMKNSLKSLIKAILIKICDYKYLGNHVTYGGSNIYDYFITMYDKSLIKAIDYKKIIKIDKIDFRKAKDVINYSIKSKEDKKKVVYISSALTESKIIDFKQEAGIVERIYKDIADKGILFVKPHPTEDNNKFVNIVDSDHTINKFIPIECIIDEFDYAITCYSSAVFNNSKTKVILIPNLVDKNMKVKEVFKDVDNLIIVDTFEELKQVIDEE